MIIKPKLVEYIDVKWGRIVFNDDSSYYGELANEQMHGMGALRLSCGDSYQGDFENGLFHGIGYYCWNGGSTYLGNFVEGKLAGKGNFKNNHKLLGRKSCIFSEIELFNCSWDSYQGDFCNNQPHGFGEVKDSQFDYVGYVENGDLHGFGKLSECWRDVLDGFSGYSDAVIHGEIIEGNFENGVINGVGTKITSSSFESGHNQDKSDDSNSREVFKGNFLHGKFHGWGVLEFYTNNILDKTYKGIFKENLLTENGIMSYADGSFYMGQYSDLYRRSGIGKLILSSGEVKEGSFLEDDFQGE